MAESEQWRGLQSFTSTPHLIFHRKLQRGEFQTCVLSYLSNIVMDSVFCDLHVHHCILSILQVCFCSSVSTNPLFAFLVIQDKFWIPRKYRNTSKHQQIYKNQLVWYLCRQIVNFHCLADNIHLTVLPVLLSSWKRCDHEYRHWTVNKAWGISIYKIADARKKIHHAK